MATPTLDFRNTNTLWCSVLVETLARCGLRSAVVSPGSRSTALTMALARHPRIEAIPVLDERSAAFFALGLARRARVPVALVCTSGTAGANYLPAVIEAHESGVPLIVITADRPPEMRDCASGQTIDQQKLFGAFVKFHHEFAVPEANLELLRYARQTMVHAFERALRPFAGPVHLNAPFRDPLAPIEDGSTAALAGKIDEAFFSHVLPPVAVTVSVTAWQRPTTARGLIIAGPASPADVTYYVTKVQSFAQATGWPVLADALSPLRHHGNAAVPGVPIVAAYDAILRDAKSAQALVPRFVICLEGWPTSKVLRGWLEQSGAEVVMVSDSFANRDALHGRTRHLPLPVGSLGAEGTAIADASYRDAWSTAAKAAESALARSFDEMTAMFEGKATWLLARHLPAGSPVFVASSMPVRDVEYFWPLTDRRHRFFFNRGANGIDGTLSSALGVAHASDAPAVLLTGDLAFLHDANGFLFHRRIHGSLTIVLINNRGGGIFEHLPIAKFDPPFEEFFAAPQDVDFAKLCAAHGVAHELVRDWAQFRELVSTLPARGIRVLEIRTDRKADVAHRRTFLTGASVASAALG